MAVSYLDTPEEAAKKIGVSPKTLAKWRWQGDGPKYLKIGSRVAYRPADIEAWLNSRQYFSTSEYRR